MKVSLSIVIMSALSDVQHGERNDRRLNFIKWLIMKYDRVKENPLGRDFEIDPDAEYKEFETKFPINEPSSESKREFEKAIKEGRLSSGPTDKNYAGNYMYMGIHGGVAMFKHSMTREYLPVPQPSN